MEHDGDPVPILGVIDRVLDEFVAAREAGDEQARSFGPWLERLAEQERAEFIERAALYLSMSGERTSTPDLPGDLDQDGKPPSHVGRFELRRVISRRPMSVVYEAWDPTLGRAVAIKVLRGDASGRATRRIQREAQTLAGLDHPCLVQVFEAGEHQGAAFLVMQLIDGPDLGDVVVADGEPGIRAEVGRASQIAEVLAWLHERGIVHRDVKPSNVLLRGDGKVALADFGLVRIIDRESTLTGPLLGTPVYMAPELAKEPAAASPAADVYSLGCMLVARLSGRAPFSGMDLPRVFGALVNGDPPFPPEAWTRLPVDLVPTLEQCLEPAPEQRPAAYDLAADLRSWLAGGRPVLGVRGALQRRMKSLSSRRGWIVGAVGAAGAVALLTHRLGWFAAGATAGDPLQRAIDLLFDRGDMETVLDPSTRCSEGMSPIARLFLAPAKSESKWQMERLQRAERLLQQLDDAGRASTDGRLLAACLACARGRQDTISTLLADSADSPAGRAIRSEIARVSDPMTPDRLQEWRELPRSELAALSSSDAFFVGLALAARLEQTGIHSEQAPLKGAEYALDYLERAAGPDSRWRGWALVLAASLHRMGLQSQILRTSAKGAAVALPDSFWAQHLRLASGIANEFEPAEMIWQCRELGAKFRQTELPRLLEESIHLSLTPNRLSKALELQEGTGGSPLLVLPICQSAFTTARFGLMQGFARAWIQREPRAHPLLQMLAIARAVAPDEVRDMKETEWDAISEVELDHIWPPTMRPWLRGIRESRAGNHLAAFPLDGDNRTVGGSLDALLTAPPAERHVHATFLNSHEVAFGKRLSALVAARRGELARTLGLVITRKRPDVLCAAIEWARLLVPSLYAADPSPTGRILVTALQGEIALGPLRVHGMGTVRELESRGIQLIASARRRTATASLEAARGALRAMIRQGPHAEAINERITGISLVVCHLAALLGDRSVVDEFANEVYRHSVSARRLGLDAAAVARWFG